MIKVFKKDAFLRNPNYEVSSLTVKAHNFKFVEMTKGIGAFKIGYVMKLEPTVKKELEDLFLKASQAY